MLQGLRSVFRRARPRQMELLIAVVGATGTGKSKLAVDLATRYNGEIVNADAMQMYRGLPIITNQIPVEEMNGIPHHLINCVELEDEPWRVGIFRREALRVIKEIRSRGKLPILVGGNHYYTSAVLFREQLVDGETDSGDDASQDVTQEEDGSAQSPSEKWSIVNASPEEMLQKLREVDPVMASRWHPNDTRKIQRSLEVYFQTGRPASEVYAEQQRQRQAAMATQGGGSGPSASPGHLRFPTIIFWVHCEKEALLTRLDRRVDSMIEQGLLAEAKTMSDYVRDKRSQGITVDQGKGIWISIGFKELAPYFSAVYAASSDEDSLQKLKESCIDSIKTATRQYAMYQIKFIRNTLWRFLERIGQTRRLYVLDGTNPADWDRCITEPSTRVVDAILNDEPGPEPKSLSELARVTLEAREAQSTRPADTTVQKCITCDLCKKTMTTDEQYEIHIRGHGHKRALKAAARRAERDKYLRKRELAKNADTDS